MIFTTPHQSKILPIHLVNIYQENHFWTKFANELSLNTNFFTTWPIFQISCNHMDYLSDLAKSETTETRMKLQSWWMLWKTWPLYFWMLGREKCREMMTSGKVGKQSQRERERFGVHWEAKSRSFPLHFVHKDSWVTISVCKFQNYTQTRNLNLTNPSQWSSLPLLCVMFIFPKFISLSFWLFVHIRKIFYINILINI